MATLVDSAKIVPTEASEEIRNLLSAAGKEHFDDVYLKRKLGASPHIKAIGCMFADIAAHAQENGLTSAEVVARICKTSDFFIALRGDSSTAIATALQILTADLDEWTRAPLDQLCRHVLAVNKNYNDEAAGWEQTIKEYGVNILKGKRSMLLYDYSSLVCAMLESAAAGGHCMDIYLPESRFLNGGYPFVRPCIENGHRVHFFPDVAIFYYMKQADLAMMGAETFFPNGDMVNTIGSELVALACKRYEKPLYIPTSLIKVDRRSVEGREKKQLFRDLKSILSQNWKEEYREQTDFVCPNLDIVPPELITAYITEEGVVPCNALFGICSNYIERLSRKLKEKERSAEV